MWAGAFRGFGNGIAAASVRVQLHLEECIAGMQPPLRGELPVSGYFDAVRFAIELVARGERKHFMWRRRRTFEKRRARFPTPQVLVHVVKGGHVERDLLVRLEAIPNF